MLWALIRSAEPRLLRQWRNQSTIDIHLAIPWSMIDSLSLEFIVSTCTYNSSQNHNTQILGRLFQWVYLTLYNLFNNSLATCCWYPCMCYCVIHHYHSADMVCGDQSQDNLSDVLCCLTRPEPSLLGDIVYLRLAAAGPSSGLAPSWTHSTHTCCSPLSASSNSLPVKMSNVFIWSFHHKDVFFKLLAFLWWFIDKRQLGVIFIDKCTMALQSTHKYMQTCTFF